MNENIKKRLTPKQIFTIPNVLSFLRLLMIPAIIILYCRYENYLAAAILVIASGITDVTDGIIARKFHMVSDLGKFLDPLADKLTLLSLVVCLCFNYIWVLVLIGLMIIKEILLLSWGLKVFKEQDKLNSSRWFGKICTVVIYLVVAFLFIAPLLSVPESVVYALIALCCLLVVLSTMLYGGFYAEQFKKSNL